MLDFRQVFVLATNYEWCIFLNLNSMLYQWKKLTFIQSAMLVLRLISPPVHNQPLSRVNNLRVPNYKHIDQELDHLWANLSDVWPG